MKCPYCKMEIIELEYYMLVVNKHRAFIEREQDGTPVMRVGIIPTKSRPANHAFCCPTCNIELTWDKQIAKEILLDKEVDRLPEGMD